MAQPRALSPSRLLTLAATILIVAVLYFGREVLLPLALAALFSFLLAPLVTRLQRWGLGRVPSVLGVVLLSTCGFCLLAWIVIVQMREVSQALPQYRKNIVAKLDALESSVSPRLQKASQLLNELSSHLHPRRSSESPAPSPGNVFGPSPSKLPSDAKSAPPDDGEAMPVRVVAMPVSVPSLLNDYLGALLSPLGSVAIVTVLVIFMLIQREDLRNRVIRLVGESQLRLTTQALDDASQRVSRFLRVQLLLNASYGITIALGLGLIGVPNPILWGLLSGLLRFAPYIGPWIGATLPILLSFAVFEGWLQPLLVVGWFVIVELVSNNVAEPWLYGASTGVSPLGIIVSALFWTWLWGGVGLVLATPLTVCITVLGRHVPQFRFLHILLGDEPPLPLGTTFYQRLLALDYDEAQGQAREFLKNHSAIELFDDVLIPALRLAEEDRHNGDLSETRQRFVDDSLRELIDDLETTEPTATIENELAESIEELPTVAKPEVICVAAGDVADELVALMLRYVLNQHAYHAIVVDRDELKLRKMKLDEFSHADLICVSALPPFAEIAARNVCKAFRVATKAPKLLVGVWTGETNMRTKEQLLRVGANGVVFTLRQAVEECERRFTAPSAIQTNENAVTHHSTVAAE
jgi:predicted PurR-regulated permease PerM